MRLVPPLALGLALTLCASCTDSAARRREAVKKDSWFELEWNGRTVRLDQHVEHAGSHVFRASGPLEPEGRLQLWLKIASPTARILPYDGTSVSQRRVRWKVGLGRGTEFFVSPDYDAIGDPFPGQTGELRLTRDGMVLEGTFSAQLRPLDSAGGEPLTLSGVRFRFYRRGYVSPIEDTDLRGGAIIGRRDDHPNSFTPGLNLTGDDISQKVARLTAQDLTGSWQLFRYDGYESSHGSGGVFELPTPGQETLTFRNGSIVELDPATHQPRESPVTVRASTEKGNLSAWLKLGQRYPDERSVLYWDGAETLVLFAPDTPMWHVLFYERIE
jgi:hypothetical protein